MCQALAGTACGTNPIASQLPLSTQHTCYPLGFRLICISPTRCTRFFLALGQLLREVVEVILANVVTVVLNHAGLELAIVERV